MPWRSETIPFTTAPTMFHVGVAVIPKTVIVVPEKHKTAWIKA
jgi:hypothetical protein